MIKYHLATFVLAVVVASLTTVSADTKKLSVPPDESWITLNGVVSSTSKDTFRLDYGEGLVTVEMDDWDWYQEGEALNSGDKVRVHGRIDDDLHEKRKIEASSVYVEDLKTHFFASAADEETDSQLALSAFDTSEKVNDGSWINVKGTVINVHDREFVLDTGGVRIQIDTINMNYNPLDDEGFQQLDEGDKVSVSGTVDLDFFEKSEIQAKTITTLHEDRSKGKS